MNTHFGKIIHVISLFCERCIAYHVRKENSTLGDTLISLLLMIPVIAMMLPVTLPVFLAMDVSHPFPAACLISLSGMATAGFILMLIENRHPSLFKGPEIRPLKQIKSFVIYYTFSLGLTFLYLLFCLILLHFLVTLTSVN